MREKRIKMFEGSILLAKYCDGKKGNKRSKGIFSMATFSWEVDIAPKTNRHREEWRYRGALGNGSLILDSGKAGGNKKRDEEGGIGQHI